MAAKSQNMRSKVSETPQQFSSDVHHRCPARCRLWLLSACAFVFATSSAVFADEEPVRPDTKAKVIGRIWKTRNLSREFSQYTQSLGRELNMQQSGAMFMTLGAQPGVFGGRMSSQSASVTQGMLILLETAPNPGTPHMVGFEQIGSIEEFQKVVRKRASQSGSELIGADDRFEVKLNLRRFTLSSPVAGKDGEQRISAVIRIDVGDGEKPDADNQPEFKIPDSFSTFYRYHDGFMYVGQTNAVHHVTLPAGDSMQPDDDKSEFDVHGRLDLRDIPEFLRQLVWQQWQAKAMTLMQRFDTEEAGKHAVRHTLGEGKIELFRSAVFDVDNVEFSFNIPKPKPREKSTTVPDTPAALQNRISFSFSTADDTLVSTIGGPEFEDTPVTANIRIEARENSKLAHALSQLNQRPSRLGSLRSDDSPLLISSSLQLPEFSQELATRFIDSLQARLQETVGDSGVFMNEVFEPLRTAIEDRELDFAMRMDGDAQTGLIMTGGCRLPDATRFRSALHSLMLASTDSAKLQIEQSMLGDAEVTSISADAFSIPFLPENVPGQIHLAATGSYLWFAIGGPDTEEKLRSLVDSRENVLNAQAESIALQIKLKLNEWMGDHEGASRAPQLLVKAAEKQMGQFFGGLFSSAVRIGNVDQKLSQKQPYTAYAEKILEANSSNLELSLRTAGRTMTLDAKVDPGVVKFLAAQYVAAQSQIFRNVFTRISPVIQGLNKDGKGNATIRFGTPAPN